MKLKAILLIFLCFLGTVAAVSIGELAWSTRSESPNTPVEIEHSISLLGDPVNTPGGGGNK